MYRIKSSFKTKELVSRNFHCRKNCRRIQRNGRNDCNISSSNFAISTAKNLGAGGSGKKCQRILFITQQRVHQILQIRSVHRPLQLLASAAAEQSSICTPSSSVHESEELQRLSTLASIAITTRGGAGTSKRFRLVPRRKRAAGDGRRGGQLRRGWPPRQVGCGGRGRARRSPTASCASRTESPTPAAA